MYGASGVMVQRLVRLSALTQEGPVVTNRLKVLVGGVQLRDGVGTVIDLVGRIATRAGLHVLANERNYASTIYGAHQFDPLLICDEPPISHGDDEIDILVALEFDANPDAPQQPNRDTILRHGEHLKNGGVLLYDASTGTVATEAFEARGIKVFPLPARQIALRELKREVVKNMVVTGALFRLLEFDMDQTFLRAFLEERFLRKGRELVDLNLTAARRGRGVVAGGAGVAALDVRHGCVGDGGDPGGMPFLCGLSDHAGVPPAGLHGPAPLHVRGPIPAGAERARVHPRRPRC